MSLKYRNFRNSNELIFVRNNHRFSYGSREAIGFHRKDPTRRTDRNLRGIMHEYKSLILLF